ncbi:MAG: glycosyltransferase family 2 protein [Akkermansiaceae bacterium]
MIVSSILLYAGSSYWAVHSALSLWKAKRAHRLYAGHRKWMDETAGEEPQKQTVLIIAVKKISQTYERFLDFVLAQDYRNYRVVFVTESKSDPAYEVTLNRIAEHHGQPEAKIVVAGIATDCAQKVHNLRAALLEVNDDDKIIAFADADLYGRCDWLACLTFPLNREQTDFTSGYRWFLPENSSFPNRFIATLGIAMESWIVPDWRMLLWGGSMAVRREIYDELNIYEKLDRCMNDDVRMTQLGHEAGKRMRYIRSAEAISPVNYSVTSLFEFGRRQYMHLGIYRAVIHYLAFLFPLLYLCSFFLCFWMLITGNLFVVITIFAVVTMNIYRQKIRGKYLQARFSGDELQTLLALNQNSWWMDPIEKFVSLLASGSALFSRQMTWGGIHYRIHGPRSVEISGRDT